MDYGPWFEREIWPNLKRNKISETRKATPIKIGFHAFHISLYLPEIFDLILFFDPHKAPIVHGLKGKFGCF